MEFEDLFDELENKFVELRYNWNRNVNCLRLQTPDQQFFDLLAPIVGVNFVAGLERSQSDWLIFATAQIANIQPTNVPDEELPLLRQQEIAMIDFIQTLDRPVRVVVRYANQLEAAFNLLDADGVFLIAEDERLIPTQSITQLRVLGTNSWQ